MGDPYVGVILDEIVTIMQANFNTEIDAIDSDLDDWITTSFMKANDTWPGDAGFPYFMVFPFGASPINTQYETGPNFEATWRIATIIAIIANSIPELQERSDKYGTALIKTIFKGTSVNVGTLNQTVDFIDLTEVTFNDFTGENRGIAGAYFAIWEVRNLYDPTA